MSDAGARVGSLRDASFTLQGFYDAPADPPEVLITAWRDDATNGETARVAVVIPMMPNPSAQRLRHRSEAVQSARRQSVPVVVLGVHAPAIDNDPAGSAAAARNIGLRLARDAGIEWVAFLDDDDTLDREHVGKLLDRAAETGADVIYPRFHVRGGTYARRRSLGDLALVMALVGWRDQTRFRDALRAGNFIPVTALVRVEAALRVGGFPVGEDIPRHPYPPHPRVEDWGLWLRMLDGGARFAQLPEITWTWRQWEGSTSAEFWE